MTMGAKRNSPALIGITGGMGSGKSRVSRFWADFMGLPRIDIDEVCRELLQRHQPGWHRLRSLLPADFFSPQGDLERGRLRNSLFADEVLRRAVNSLIHPLAQEQLLRLAGTAGGPVVLVDVPLLYEAGWQGRFDRCVVVYADRATCCRRLVARDGVSPGEAVRSMAVQMELAEKALLAQHVIDNSGCWLRTRLQVMHLARLLTGSPGQSDFGQESP